MKENNEQLRSAEEIAYATWRKLVNQNWANVAGEIQTAIEEYAEGVEQELKAKFKSHSPIEQKTAEAISLLKLAANIIDDCNRYMGANLVNGEIEQFFIRYKDYQFKSQPLPIEQKTVEEILKKHLPEFPELGIRGGEVYDNTGRPATCDVQNAMEEYASQFKSQLPIEKKDKFVKYLESEADKFQKDGGNSEYFAGGIRYAAHLVRLDGTEDARQPLGIAHLMKSQPSPIEGVEREQLREAFEAGQHADDYDQWVKHNYDFDEWLATRKGSKSGK